MNIQLKKQYATKDVIISFWYKFLVQNKQIVNLTDIQGRCFACLVSTPHLDRAHILPHNQGGSSDESNLHLLCRLCHLESEYIHGDVYMEWFLGMSPARRALIEFFKYSNDHQIKKYITPPLIKQANPILIESYERVNKYRNLVIHRQRTTQKKMGRPSKITEHTYSLVCDDFINKIPLKKIALKHMIGVGSVYSILRKRGFKVGPTPTTITQIDDILNLTHLGSSHDPL